MHIVAIVVAVLGAAAVWYWRFQMLREAGRDVADVFGRVRGAHRMRKFRNKAESSVLNTIEDPALAATVFFFALAGESTPGAMPAPDLIKATVGDIVPAEKLDETIAYSAWAARSVADPRDCVRRFKPLWQAALDPAERDELIRMAETIVGRTPLPHQKLTLEALRGALAS